MPLYSLAGNQPTDFFKYSVVLLIVSNKEIETPVDGLFHVVDVV
jgi:hypothetical protein